MSQLCWTASRLDSERWIIGLYLLNNDPMFRRVFVVRCFCVNLLLTKLNWKQRSFGVMKVWTRISSQGSITTQSRLFSGSTDEKHNNSTPVWVSWKSGSQHLRQFQEWAETFCFEICSPSCISHNEMSETSFKRSTPLGRSCQGIHKQLGTIRHFQNGNPFLRNKNQGWNQQRVETDI